ELVWKIQDIAYGRSPERIDRLRIVADYGKAMAARFERQQDGRLQPVGVLVLVDEHMVETAADIIRQRGLAHGLRPVEQEIVIVEHVLTLFCVDIASKQFLEFGRPSRAPRK